MQPEVFLKTGGKFTIKANGEITKWTLTTYNGSQKTATTSNSTSTSGKCSNGSLRPDMDELIATENNIILTYPNPVSDKLTVKVPLSISGNAIISITDITGKTYSVKVLENNINGVTTFDMLHLSRGLYYIKVSTDKETKVFKIVKQ